MPRTSPSSLALLPALLAAGLFTFGAACTGGGGDGGGGSGGSGGADAGDPDGAAPADDAGPGADAEVEPADPFELPAEVPLEGLRDALGRARCAFDARCGVGFAGTDAATCVQAAGDNAWHPEAIERMTALGRLDYDPAVMAQCLSWLAARPCEAVGRAHGVVEYAGGRDYFIRDADADWMASEPCRRALIAPGAGGEGCAHNVECASNTCVGREDFTCGACLPVEPADGADCTEGRCPEALRCVYDTGECLPRVGAGEPCVNDSWCTADLRCDRPGAELGVCVALGPVGRECDDTNLNSGLCPIDSVCYRGACQDLPLRFAGEGEPCGRDPDEPACRPDLKCRTEDEGQTFTCRRFDVGDDCGYAERTPSPLSRIDLCPPTLVCAESETCAEPGAVGDGCRGSRDCANPLFCEPESSTCQPRLGPGEVCSAYPAGSECAYPLNCVGSRLFGSDDGTCQPGAGLGEPCAGKEDCAPDLRCNEDGPSGRCIFYPSFGSSYFGCR